MQTWYLLTVQAHSWKNLTSYFLIYMQNDVHQGCAGCLCVVISLEENDFEFLFGLVISYILMYAATKIYCGVYSFALAYFAFQCS